MYFHNYDIVNDRYRCYLGLSHEINDLKETIDALLLANELELLEDHIIQILFETKRKKPIGPSINDFRIEEIYLDNNEKLILIRFFKSYLYFLIKKSGNQHKYFNEYQSIFDSLTGNIKRLENDSLNDHRLLEKSCYDKFIDKDNEVYWWEYSFYFYGAKPYIPYRLFQDYSIISTERIYKNRLSIIQSKLEENWKSILNQCLFYESDYDFDKFSLIFPDVLRGRFDFEIPKSTIPAENIKIALKVNRNKLTFFHQELINGQYIKLDSKLEQFKDFFYGKEIEEPIIWLKSISELGKLFTYLHVLEKKDGTKLLQVSPLNANYKMSVVNSFKHFKNKQITDKNLASTGGKGYTKSYQYLKKIVDNLKED